ncbi:MAG: hypothetical protein H6Q86_2660 [candidate division NC10 bacterium]|jgi:hypothetical protein|nr:hypothetical protein [candidate division NC10 bacterium]MBP2672720.1 hypothetical protein [candidate division NC10 bacterium]
MRTKVVLLVTLALTLPSLAMAHPCEVEVARLKKDLEEIRRAVATIEAVPPSDMQRQMLAGAKGKYDLELRRSTEAQALCERKVREENPGTTASPALAGPTEVVVVPPPAPPPAPPSPPAPAAAVLVPPAVKASPPPAAPAPVAASPGTSATPATPCLTGCGKDTDCKGDRICVNGACQDPPSR